MPKHLDAEPVVERGEYALAPPLPDLSGVDLRTLRRMDTPALTAAVAHVLSGAGEGSELFSQNPPSPDDDFLDGAGPCGG
ncbi:hypothetical protein [Streptomyces winkii]|uniref:hypothetical protein n=1 Tax=Streptomyces winkii TaxID=3051178 RepID=UPI0028D82073|nr:hypothetical protein [Streptomyces sp. DSM 40971]